MFVWTGNYQFDETQVGFGLHCHCEDCQRVTGSGKATVVLFPLDAVSIEPNTKPMGSEGSHVSGDSVPTAAVRCLPLSTKSLKWYLSKRYGRHELAVS